MDYEFGSNHWFPWLPTMTEITAIGGANFFKQKCWVSTSHHYWKHSLRTALNFCVAQSRTHVGCGDVARVGTSRDGRSIAPSNPHIHTPSHLHSFASAWLASRWSEVGICNRIDETAKGSFTLPTGQGRERAETASIGTLLAGTLASLAPSRRWIPWS